MAIGHNLLHGLYSSNNGHKVSFINNYTDHFIEAKDIRTAIEFVSKIALVVETSG
jgi:hypothetical protein